MTLYVLGHRADSAESVWFGGGAEMIWTQLSNQLIRAVDYRGESDKIFTNFKADARGA